MSAAGRERVAKLLALLAEAYPEARCELNHRNAYELLVATILSAQCTDARVNQVTPAFFARFPNAQALAQASQEEVEKLIKSTGFYRNKAKALIGMAKALVERHGGEVPKDMEAMVQLPGVGRKTANVVLGTAYGLATGIVVDTHVSRVAQRLGLTTAQDPESIEQDLMALFPRQEWVALSHRLILHGRYVCKARKPACTSCVLAEVCPRVGV
ncbi:Endonuclease III [bacterium HR09]|nr:Endonuclease III [bacterium HR09]